MRTRPYPAQGFNAVDPTRHPQVKQHRVNGLSVQMIQRFPAYSCRPRLVAEITDGLRETVA
jgi:hypothetical protein